jgi:hypothetical protein
MAGTRRTPINRQAVQASITPAAVEIFRLLERAKRARKRATDCTLNKYNLCSGQCRACCDWWNAHDALHSEMKLRPWVWPCVPRCPYPPNTPPARAWRPSVGQQELYAALVEASHAAVAIN